MDKYPTLLLILLFITGVPTVAVWIYVVIIKLRLPEMEPQKIENFFTKRMRWPESEPERLKKVRGLIQLKRHFHLSLYFSFGAAALTAFAALITWNFEGGKFRGGLLLSAALLAVAGAYLAAKMVLIKSVERKMGWSNLS